MEALRPSYPNGFLNARRAKENKDIDSKVLRLVKKMSPIKSGFKRALEIFKMIDHVKTNETISCKRGCSHCCKHNQLITSDEADLLVRVGKIDKEYLEMQLEFCEDPEFWWKLPYVYSKCMFLDNDQCTVYKNRPSICRNHAVSSVPENCSNGHDRIFESTAVCNERAEIVASAARMLPEQKTGMMPQMIKEALIRAMK